MKAKELKENQRPEQLVYCANKCTKHAHGQGSVSQSEKESRYSPKRNAYERERNRSKQGGHQAFTAEKVGRYDSKEEIAQISPGIGCCDGNIGKQKPDQGNGKENKTGTNRWGREHGTAELPSKET